MPNPRLIIDLDGLKTNARTLIGGLKGQSVDVWAVTKVLCGDPEAARVFVEAGASAVADSRLANLERLRNAGVPGPFALLRIADPNEASDVVRLANVSLQSELATLEALDAASRATGTAHDVVLMVDLGDLREGVPAASFPAFVDRAGRFGNLRVVGIGTNLTCYGGVLPDESNLRRLLSLHDSAQKTLDRAIPLVSGGNSSSLYLWERGTMPEGITNLRLGESLVLGRETAFGERIPGTRPDAVILRATVVELKRKDSVPTGTIGMDAFGRRPQFTDRGERLRAILAVGEQDVLPGGLTPLDPGIDIIGASSDHLILDAEDYEGTALVVGSSLDFRLDYGALLRAATSTYVNKEYRGLDRR